MSRTDCLLVELFTEELPPKALRRLSESFSQALTDKLRSAGLLAEPCDVESFATPRRLATRLSAVVSQAQDRLVREKLMPVSVGLDAQGQPTPALRKKLAAKGLDADAVLPSLLRESDGKADQLIWQGTQPGASLAEGLQQAIEAALAALPIPKVMSYQLADGQTTVRFVRPAHRLVALHGTEIVPVSILGLQSGRQTGGHRFQGQAWVEIDQAQHYDQTLRKQGHVLPGFDERRNEILRQLQAKAGELGSSLGEPSEVETLLEEVTALVEYPTVYVGEFEPEFLAVPPECLILTMRLNQKYFPLFAADGQTLTHRFLIVSNMKLDHPVHVIQGNQRVVRPRLADARFFYQTDLRTPLQERNAALASVVFHNKLGSQADRVQRLQALAQSIARRIGADIAQAARAAELSKSDLATLMVGEFPELQGLMGAYYAAHAGEPLGVQQALREQYRLRVNPLQTAEDKVSLCLFLADRADSLVSLWAAAGAPSGDKDPYALRRAALGLLSGLDALAQAGLTSLTLQDLIQQAAQGVPNGLASASVMAEVEAFVLERLRQQLITQYPREAVEAVLAVAPALHEVPARIAAVQAFGARPEAEALAAANKRIGNVLRKVEGELGACAPAHLQEAAEQALFAAIERLQPQAESHLARLQFEEALGVWAELRTAVDSFFADVMVMTDDITLRNNRLALLAQAHAAMNRVADLSRLA